VDRLAIYPDRARAHMPPFPKPTFKYGYNAGKQVALLRAHKAARGIPAKAGGKLLVLTWNIANLGQQERADEDITLIAEIMSWFDVVAVQECKENLGHLFDILHKLGNRYRALSSDASGNNERMAFLYNANKVKLLEEVGEIAFPPSHASSRPWATSTCRWRRRGTRSSTPSRSSGSRSRTTRRRSPRGPHAGADADLPARVPVRGRCRGALVAARAHAGDRVARPDRARPVAACRRRAPPCGRSRRRAASSIAWSSSG
jgi:hypothetical protein